MVLAHSLLGGDVAEHVILLLIGSSHAPLDVLYVASLHIFVVFQQPVRAFKRFSWFWGTGLLNCCRASRGIDLFMSVPACAFDSGLLGLQFAHLPHHVLNV